MKTLVAEEFMTEVRSKWLFLTRVENVSRAYPSELNLKFLGNWLDFFLFVRRGKEKFIKLNEDFSASSSKKL